MPNPAYEARALRALADACNEAARYVRIAVDSCHGLGRRDDANRLERIAEDREDEALRLNLRAAEVEAGLGVRSEIIGAARRVAASTQHQGN
jgi:hypothetical protein